MKKILFVSILLIAGFIANAQCNKGLVEIAKSKLTESEVFINEFKVKLKEADVNDPAPVAKFSQKFEKGHKYRLRIESDKTDYHSNGILRLFESNKFLGTTYEESRDTCHDSFVFICKKTMDYILLVTFHNGKAGCAVVVVSEVE